MLPIIGAEHHVHLEATIRPETFAELAHKHGIEIPDGLTSEDGQRFLYNDLTDFMRVYDIVTSVIKDPEDFYRVAYEYLLKNADDNVMVSELIYSPHHMHMAAGMSHKDCIDMLSRAIDDARTATSSRDIGGIEGRLICTIVRHENNSIAYGEEIASFLADTKPNYVTGFGLAGIELEDDVFDYAKAFAIAKQAGLGLSPHAGEAQGPAAIQNTLAAIPDVDRIGHGVRCLEDDHTIQMLKDKNITLEICPASNIETRCLSHMGVSDHASYPLPALLDHGLNCSLNSDDPAFFGPSVAEEYKLAHKHMGVAVDDLMRMSRHALDTSFIDDAKKQELLSIFDRHIDLYLKGQCDDESAADQKKSGPEAGL